MQSIYGAGVLVHGHTDGVLGQSIPKSNGAHQRAPRPLVLHHIHSIKSVNLHVDCDRMRPVQCCRVMIDGLGAFSVVVAHLLHRAVLGSPWCMDSPHAGACVGDPCGPPCAATSFPLFCMTPAPPPDRVAYKPCLCLCCSDEKINGVYLVDL